MSKLPISAADFLPIELDLESIKDASKSCRGCDLYRAATQTVFGEGLATAKAVFVGEQPGDEEDLTGRPFVGPAGKLFRKVLDEVGINLADIYITNAVKHFKWKARGKRRIHEKPRASEVFACSAWLDAELALIEPKILVCLGATASQSLFGKDFRVTKMSGKWIDSTYADRAIATIHPSAILRTPSDRRPDVYSGFVADMTKVAGELRKS